MSIKVIQTLYSGLGGHASVVFSLLNSEFGKKSENFLVFYGIEQIPDSYLKKLKYILATYYFIKKKQKQYVQPLLKFFNLLRKVKPDVIIIHNSELIVPANFYKKFSKIKIIFVEHEPNHIKNRINWFLSNYALKKADVVVCLNESYKFELINKYKKYSAQIVLIPNGINTQNFRRKREIQNCQIIGMAARITKTKDHKVLLKAFKKLLSDFPFLKLKIAGTGELEDQILDLISTLKLKENVEMLGLLDEEEMIDFLNQIDLYVHATLSETLSTSILQAMSCELPVITSDIKNNMLLIDEGKTGYFYENENVESLYQKMKYAIENYDETPTLRKAARKEVIKQYSNQKMGERYLKLIES